MPRDDQIDACLVQQPLHIAAHRHRFVSMERIRVVPGHVHLDNEPGRALPIECREVTLEPPVLERAGMRRSVGAEGDQMDGADITRPPKIRLAAT